MQNGLRFLTAGILIACAAAVSAAPQDTPVASSPTPAVAPAAVAAGKTQTVAVADFSQGFAVLHRMGVTNVAKATYVTLSGPSVMYVTQGTGSRYGLKGNAWQLSGDSTNGLFLVNETMLVRATSAKPAVSNGVDPFAQVRFRGYYGPGYEDGEGDDESLGGTSVRTLYDVKWKPADLQADIANLLAKLQKEADKFLAAKAKKKSHGEDEDESENPMRRAQVEVAGYDVNAWVACLLGAAHYADQGHLAEANRLAALTMTLGGGNAHLLEAVMNRLGNEAYQMVWAKFRATGNWKAYIAGLDGVVARFPRGWQQLASARELASRIRAFDAAGARPAPLKTSLRPADQALADALATAPATRETTYASQQAGFWVLPRNTNDFVGVWVATNAHPLARLLRSGTNAIPVLLALLDDSTTFTRLQTTAALPSTNTAATADATDDAESMQEMMRAEMERMRGSGGMPGGGAGLLRPALRSEIAKQLLQALVGGDQNANMYSSSHGRRNQPQEKTLAERVRLWQEKNAGLTNEELAFACLAGKDYNQRSQAMQYLAASPSTSVWLRLEKQILGSANLDQDQWLVQTYVMRRGKDAKAFVDAFEARIVSGALPTNAVKVATVDGSGEEELFKAASDHDPRSDKYRIQQQKRMLKELRRIVDAKPLDVLVDEIATGKISPEAGREIMGRSFYETPYAKRMEIALRGAAKAQAPDVRINLLHLTLRPDNSAMVQYEASMAQRGGVPSDKPEPPSAKALAEVWRTLLADARPSTNRSPNIWHPPLTVRETAAMSMELVYGRPSDTELNARMLVDELGASGLQLLLQRAESRLSGAASVQPPLPDPASVPAGRLAELTNALPRAALSARATQVVGLDVHTRLALARAARTNTELAAALAPLAHRMRALLATNTPEKARAALQACDGKVLDATVLQGLVRQCDELAKQGQPVTFELLRRAGCDGVEVAARVALPIDAIGRDSAAGVGIGVETLDSAPETLLLHPGASVQSPGAVDAAEDPLKRPTDAELIASEIARLQRGPMTAAEAEASFWKRIATLCAADTAIGFPAGIRITPVK